mgnify:FL=1
MNIGVVLLADDVKEYLISEDTGANVIQLFPEHVVVVKNKVVSSDAVTVLLDKQASPLQLVVVDSKVVSLKTVLVDHVIGGIGTTKDVGSTKVELSGLAETLIAGLVAEAGMLVESTGKLVELVKYVEVTVLVETSLELAVKFPMLLKAKVELEFVKIGNSVIVTVISGSVTVSVTVTF